MHRAPQPVPRRLVGVVALLATAGCDHAPPSTDSAARPSASVEPLGLLSEFGEVPPKAPAAPLAANSPFLPQPGRRRGREAVALHAGCVACHHEEAAEWQGSRHQQSDTNAAYRRAVAVEPNPFCRACHAPESDPRSQAPRAESELGVGCVTCHVTADGAVLAAESPGRTGPSEAPHRVVRSAEFAGSGACAGCHEFRFPGERGHTEQDFMQLTVREHAQSRGASTPCAGCHMPAVGTRRSHSFAEVRDPAWLARHLDVAVERTAEGVRLTLSQPKPGHGFPTGDLFRRLEVGAEARGQGGEGVVRATRHLARHLVRPPGGTRRVLVRDDRVRDEPVVVELALGDSPAERAGTIAWWVDLQRVATVGDGADPAQVVMESTERVRSGSLP